MGRKSVRARVVKTKGMSERARLLAHKQGADGKNVAGRKPVANDTEAV